MRPHARTFCMFLFIGRVKIPAVRERFWETGAFEGGPFHQDWWWKEILRETLDVLRCLSLPFSTWRHGNIKCPLEGNFLNGCSVFKNQVTRLNKYTYITRIWVSTIPPSINYSIYFIQKIYCYKQLNVEIHSLLPYLNQ